MHSYAKRETTRKLLVSGLGWGVMVKGWSSNNVHEIFIKLKLLCMISR